MTLTEQAQALPYGKRFYEERTEEEVDLAIAWMQGEIANAQVATIIDRDPTPAVYWVANTLRQAVKAGKITITKQ